MRRSSFILALSALAATGFLALPAWRGTVGSVPPVARKVVISRRAPRLGAGESGRRIAVFAGWRAQLAAATTPVARHALLGAFAADDPRLALEFARSPAIPEAARYATICDILRVWAVSAPRESWAWVQQNSAALTPDDEMPLEAAFFSAVATQDPSLVLTFADESLSDSRGTHIAFAAVNALLEKGRADLARQKIEDWASDPASAAAVGNGAFQAMALHLARDSDAGAAGWVLALPASPERDAAAVAVAAEWANHDPVAALAWAQTLGEDDGRAVAMGRAFRVWADHGTMPAAEWLLDHEALPQGDRLIAEFVGHSEVVDRSPQTALHWVSLIRDDTLRRKGLAAVLEKWHERDPATASRFLTANGFSSSAGVSSGPH